VEVLTVDVLIVPHWRLKSTDWRAVTRRSDAILDGQRAIVRSAPV
jgi:hypothetical protein